MTNQSELKSIVGEIPNYIFECLELSDEIKEEWKHGSKASDFGRHNQFVQRFSKRIEAFITTDRKHVALEAIGGHVRETYYNYDCPNKLHIFALLGDTETCVYCYVKDNPPTKGANK